MSQTHKRKKEGFQGQKAIVVPRKILQNSCASDKLIHNLYITDIGYYPKAFYHYRSRPLGAEQHILIYCMEGRGTVTIKSKILQLQPGNFVLIPARDAHTYQADENNPWTIYWVHFTGSMAATIASFFIRKNGGNNSHIKYSEPVISLFNEMYGLLERGYGHDHMIYANMCLYHFLMAFIYNDKLPVSGNLKSKEEVDTAIDFLKKNTHRALTLNEMAGSVNLSPPYFSALFKKKTGFTPVEYFNHLKMQQACQYLLFTSLRIKEIALQLGMDDQYYFSRVFTRVMGVSPANYREDKRHH